MSHVNYRGNKKFGINIKINQLVIQDNSGRLMYKGQILQHMN